MTSLFFKKLRAVSREAIAVCAACVILIGCGGGGGGLDGTPAVMVAAVVMTPGGGMMMPIPCYASCCYASCCYASCCHASYLPDCHWHTGERRRGYLLNQQPTLLARLTMPLESVIDGLTGDDTASAQHRRGC